MENKYTFQWNLLGDIEEGRPHLGRSTRVEVYRLMQFTLREVIETRYGSGAADEIFYEAGKIAGKHFFQNLVGEMPSLDAFVRKIQDLMKEMSIGILRIEKADLENGTLVLTVAEDLDCSGLPELDYEICVYDEGFISGLLESYTGKKFTVKEIDCWCTGDRTCRFRAEVAK
jgi:predicted hydrocarbon binding protein